MPVRKTTGNSSPLAVCSVISVTMPPWSASLGDLVGVGDQRDLLEEGAASPPASLRASNSLATEISSVRFSARPASCRSVDASSSAI